MKECDNTENQSVSIVKSVSSRNVDANRANIENLEGLILKEEQAVIDVIHRFCGGMYAREIIIPESTLLTGRIHKFDHFDVMVSGDITVSTDSGDVKRMQGFNVFEGKAGKKRAGYAHKETRWITFHSAEEREPEEMYEFLTCSTFEEFDHFNIMLEQAILRINSDEQQLKEVAKNILNKDSGGDTCQ